MSELLAPAGSMEALRAAIANGCDAVYLGMKRFGARAYSSNFDEESLAQAVGYAHLRGVKVYVTVNTIAFEDELSEVFRQLHFLNSLGVDGVIAQDLAVLTYVARHFLDMEAHCSTQMGVDDLEGVLLCKELGAKRVVISREVPIERVREIRRQSQMPIEAFVHGALCVSYSGNCIMSGMTGNRSGNRGRCIGSCRKLYDVVKVAGGEESTCETGDAAGMTLSRSDRLRLVKQSTGLFQSLQNSLGERHAGSIASPLPDGAGAVDGSVAEKLIGRSYILSTKDLNTIDSVDELAEIDSLKIEGRMKEPVYVANVVSRYRMALDGAASADDKQKLNRTFNRTFTKGYLFGEDRRDIVNAEKPNHFGYRIGTVVGGRKGRYEIALTDELRQNDTIRIRHKGEDVNLSVAKLYDEAGRLVNRADSTCFIQLREKLSSGDAVYKTKDVQFEKELEARLEGEFRRFPLDFAVYAYPGAPLVVAAEGFGLQYTYEGDEVLSETMKQPTTKEAVVKQLSRLNDTVFELGNVEYEDCNAFVPAKMLNAARKDIVAHLYEQRLAAKPRREFGVAGQEGAVKQGEGDAIAYASEAATCASGDAVCGHEVASHKPISFEPCGPYLTAFATTQEQYDACRECGIETIYFRNFIPRNSASYQDLEGEVLVGGLGGVFRYRDTNPLVADYSLNTVNAKSCYELHRLGARRVTLSYEINEAQLYDLLDAYQRESGGNPALEMIVYGHAPLMVTKYCPLKALGQCGACRTHRFELRDEFGGAFPILSHESCDTTILNGKALNLLDEMPGIQGIEAFRLNFTVETPDEVREIIAKAQAKLAGKMPQPAFNPETDTRGYFNKEIL